MAYPEGYNSKRKYKKVLVVANIEERMKKNYFKMIWACVKMRH